MEVQQQTVESFSLQSPCHAVLVHLVPFPAKRTCSLVPWGCCLKGVWSPTMQQCQCLASRVHSWWWLFFWSHWPVVDHWRGQDTLSWHSSLLVTRIVSSSLLWAWCKTYSLLVSFPLAPSTQWSRQIETGQHLTDWGLPSLRGTSADQWAMKIPPTTGDNPQHLNLCQSVWTCNCCLLCCFCHCEQRHWSDLFRAQSWAKCMEILGYPIIRNPLSALPMWSKGEQSSISGIELAEVNSPTTLGAPLLVFP